MSAERKVFGKLQGMAKTPPNLIDIQTKSYHEFLQADIPPQKRDNVGLQAIFKEIFPVTSFDGRYKLDFVSYTLDPAKKTSLQALMDGETYARPLRATFRLTEGEDAREEEVFLGDMPVMTPDGAFVINGAERVIVSQLNRSPGISSERQVHANGQPLLSFPIAATGSKSCSTPTTSCGVSWISAAAAANSTPRRFSGRSGTALTSS